MQLQNRLLLPEDTLGVVAQLADVLGIEEELALLWCLPRARAQQLVDNALVRALGN